MCKTPVFRPERIVRTDVLRRAISRFNHNAQGINVIVL